MRIETGEEEAKEVENYEEEEFSKLNDKKLLIAVETGLEDLVTPSSNNRPELIIGLSFNNLTFVNLCYQKKKTENQFYHRNKSFFMRQIKPPIIKNKKVFQQLLQTKKF